MAYLVEEHYSHGTKIPEYWQPDGAPHVMPCATEQDAIALEIELREQKD